MANLNLKIQGPQGRNPKWKENQGYISAFIDHENDQRIIVDAFQGHGKDYKKRENCQITIANGHIEWTGSFKDLCKKLEI